MPSGSNRELMEAVKAWVEANYPACPLDYIAIHLRYLPVPIQLADMPLAMQGGGNLEERPAPVTPFVPSPFQRAILEALDGKALRSDALGVAVGDRSRLFKRGGLKELEERGKVAHHSRLGYYRPDALPPELRGTEQTQV